MGVWHKCTRTPVGHPDGQRFTFAPIVLTENLLTADVSSAVPGG